MSDRVRVAVALEGYGWHPQAWRHRTTEHPATTGRYWAQVAATAERGLLDFATFDDSLSPQRRRRPAIDARWSAGRPDAVLVASLVAAQTRHIGLVPVAVTTHTGPAEVAKALATLDHISDGRAGWQVRVSSTRHEAELFGRRDPEDLGDLFAEARDDVELVRGLWRGEPVVTALAHNPAVYRFAASCADLVFITPMGDESVTAIRAEVANAGGRHLQVWADLYVTFAGVVDERSDAEVFSGSPAELADKIGRWHQLGVHGVRLRPAVLSADLPAIVDDVIPLLQRRNGFRTSYRAGETLRQRLGLAAPRTCPTTEGNR